MTESRFFSVGLDRLPDLVDLGGGRRPVGAGVAEDVRVAPVHLGGDVAGHVVDGEGAALLGDHGVEVDLQQQVAQLLAQVRPVTRRVTAVDRLERLVGLLEQVAGERAVGLLGLPRALGPQPAHHLEELEQRRLGPLGHQSRGSAAGGGQRQAWRRSWGPARRRDSPALATSPSANDTSVSTGCGWPSTSSVR